MRLSQVVGSVLFDANRSAQGRWLGEVFLLVFLFASPKSNCPAQEPTRPSLAGPQVAAVQREAALLLPHPVVQLGPTTWSLGTGIGLQGSDNIRLEAENPRSDLAAHPEIHARMLCPVSANNVLNLNLRTGYSAYVKNPGFNHFYIGPESALNFEIYAGDFRIDLHDRCSLLENNYEDPTVVGSGDYTRLENGAGVGVVWDLNKALIRAGYDHINYISYVGTTSIFPDSASEELTASAGYRLRSGCLAGVESSGTLFHYAETGSGLADALQATVGPFLDVQISEYLAGRGSVGYRAYSPEGGDTVATMADDYGLYAHLDLSHNVSPLVDYTLSGGKNISFALYGGTVDLAYIQLRANWHLIRKVGLSTSLAFEHGSDLSRSGETFARYGPGISVDRVLAERLTGTLTYQWYRRDSNESGRNYTTNMLLAHLTYEF